MPSGSNRLFLCPLDVLNIWYCHQPVLCVLVTSCHVARFMAELRGVCVCVCGSPLLVVASVLVVA